MVKESGPLNWRQMSLGQAVWVPWGGTWPPLGWRAATIMGFGKNRGENTVCHVRFDRGGKSRRHARELWTRRPELKGKDKPARQSLSTLGDATLVANAQLLARGGQPKPM